MGMQVLTQINIKYFQPESIRRFDLKRKTLSLVGLFLICVQVMPPVSAREIKIKIPRGQNLTVQQKADLETALRESMRQHRKESFTSSGNQYSVMATANCIEGYVQNADVKTSARDVEIVSEKGVLCDSGGCEGWLVEARRESEALFDLEISLKCSKEDFLVIEQEGQE